MKAKQVLAVLAACLILIATGLFGAARARQEQAAAEQISTGLMENVMENINPYGQASITLPDHDFVALLDIVGTIQASTGTSMGGQYDHSLYMDLVNQLMDCETNKGIMLYVDSPGGTVYESDELYLKLMEYKQKTGRPIYAYFASTAASGAYYISMAADYIYANRNCTTGSIGVIVSFYDYHALLEKAGISEINITSGANKAMGSGGVEMTPEQREIFQKLVDEAYDQFVGIVANGRGMKEKKVRKLADGRIYTAAQALEEGLVDEILGEEDAYEAISDRFGNPDIEYYAPETPYSPTLRDFLGMAADILQGRADREEDLTRSVLDNIKEGELMYYAR